MYLLDTNVVSMLDPRRHAKGPALIEWLDRNGASIFLSVMTIAGMQPAFEAEARGKTQAGGRTCRARFHDPLADFGERVLPVDIETARHAARLGEAVHRQPAGLPDI